MLRWLLYLVLAAWVARLVRQFLPGPPRQRATDFHPGAGAAHPSSTGEPVSSGPFSSGDVVDAEFEDVPPRHRP